MKFTIDTVAKTIVILEDMTLGELNVLKNFIGEDWIKWKIRAAVKVSDKLPSEPLQGKYPFIHFYTQGSLRITREKHPYGLYMVESSNPNSLAGVTLPGIISKTKQVS